MVAVFLLGFFWFVHGNQFPSFYHPEEEIRAKQVIRREWDLHEPLLSAITTRVLKPRFTFPTIYKPSFNLAEPFPHCSRLDRSSVSA